MSGKEKVLKYMQKHKSITQLQALNLFWDWRLSDKIYRLRKEGHKIISEQIKVKKADGSYGYVAKYTLED